VRLTGGSANPRLAGRSLRRRFESEAAGKTSTAEMMNAEATIYMSFGGLGAMPGMPAKVLARECNG
jgi:hypothetical protein